MDIKKMIKEAQEAQEEKKRGYLQRD